MKLLVATLCVALAACGKFDDKLEGPSPVPEKDADWRNYGTMPDFSVWVDVNSVTHLTLHDKGAPNFTYVWMWQRFNDDQIDGQSKGKYRDKYTRQAIDCPSGRMAGTAVELRDPDGNTVARYDVPGYQWEFSDQPANTYGADFVRQVCKIMAEKDAKQKSEE